jgi:hypothetical protein
MTKKNMKSITPILRVLKNSSKDKLICIIRPDKGPAVTSLDVIK